MVFRNQAITLLFKLLFVLSLFRCGSDAGFSGGNFGVLPDRDNDPGLSGEANRNNGDLDGSTIVENDELEWLWACDNKREGLAVNAEIAQVFDEGPHAINSDGNNFELKVRGELCISGQINRDIIFVVDLSSSMVSNDPVRNNSCGRMAAIKSVIESVANPDRIRVGLVTFDSKQLTKVSLTTADQLLSDNINRNTLCKSRLFGSTTNYRAGLEDIKSMMADEGRKDALKEVYFLSDGLGRNNTDGAPEASEIRKADIKIATLMLRGDDSTLKTHIASKDNNGKPLHAKIDDAGDLSKSLEDLATAHLISAKAFYRATGSKDWTSLKMFKDDKVKSLFSLNLGVVKPAEAADGVQFKYNYTDNRGNQFVREGDLYWDD